MFDKTVRPSGYYLAKDREEDGTDVVRIITNKSGTEVLLAGLDVGYTVEDFYWISEYPLNLEQLAINDGYNAAIIKRVQDEFGVKIGEDGEDVIQN